jgi:hypothetical protein
MIAILYSAKTKLTPMHQKVKCDDFNGARSIWIRITTISELTQARGFTLSDALDLARPMTGETVLNTIYV